MTLSPVRVLIVEDQPNVRTDVQFLVENQNGFTVAGTAATVSEAKKVIETTKPDLLLLDIYLPDGTAFDLLQGISQRFRIIFLTAYQQHAIQAIKIGALDYLLKPVDEVELAKALQKVRTQIPFQPEQITIAGQYHNNRVRQRMVIHSQDCLQIVTVQEIVYCHGYNGYTTFYLTEGRKILTTKILKDFEYILCQPVFIRPHQSYIVNSRYINKYLKKGLLLLKGGIEIPVSVRRKEMVLKYFNQL